jgi:hypothetical protein
MPLIVPSDWNQMSDKAKQSYLELQETTIPSNLFGSINSPSPKTNTKNEHNSQVKIEKYEYKYDVKAINKKPKAEKPTETELDRIIDKVVPLPKGGRQKPADVNFLDNMIKETMKVSKSNDRNYSENKSGLTTTQILKKSRSAVPDVNDLEIFVYDFE